MTRNLGRSDKGKRCYKTVHKYPFVKFNFICAIKYGKVIGYKLYQKDGHGIDNIKFNNFYNEYIKNKYKNQLLILDNARFHKSKDVINNITDSQNEIIYTIPYNPSCNPIENFFSHMNLQRATKMIPAEEEGGLIQIQMENGGILKARTVILSTGARWRNVNVPGEQEYKNKGVAYCPHCDGPLFKGKRTAVIGGGNSGIEAAIDLAGIVAHVTVIEFADQLKADAVLVKKLKSLSNVTVHTNAQTTEITGDGSVVNGIRFKDRVSGQEQHIALEGVFVQIGLIPNTEFLKDTLELSKFGEIVVDAKGHTNVSGVFAAGDCTTVPFKQIVIAAGDGAKAALSAFDHLIRTPVAA